MEEQPAQRPGSRMVKVCSGSKKMSGVDCETKLWKALNARLRPGQGRWDKILTLGDREFLR